MVNQRCLRAASWANYARLFALLWSVSWSTLFAQTYTYSPAAYEPGIAETLDVSYATGSGITAVSFDIELPFKADIASKLVVDVGDSSWLGTASKVSSTANLSTDGKTLHLDLWRPDSIPQTGEGWIVQVRGIIVETELPDYRLMSKETFRLYPQPAYQYFHLEAGENEALQRMTILDQAGRQVRQFPARTGKHSLLALPPGLYYLRVETQAGGQVLPLLRISP